MTEKERIFNEVEEQKKRNREMRELVDILGTLNLHRFGWQTDVAALVLGNGYRRIKKGDVVMTKDEYAVLNAMWNACGEVIAKVRKETAREFVEKLKKKLYTNNYCQEIVTEEHIDETLREFVE